MRKPGKEGEAPPARCSIMSRSDIAKSLGISPQDVSAIGFSEFGPGCVAVSPNGERYYNFDEFIDFARDFARGYISLADVSEALDQREENIKKWKASGKKRRRRRGKNRLPGDP
jgi:hypothetical protein